MSSCQFKRPVRTVLLTGIALSALALPIAVIAVPSAPAFAQRAAGAVEFRTALQPYGAWHRIARWGDVWVPAHVGRDWRPYTRGHWVYSNDYGWYWNSDPAEAGWGLVVYHYGRWFRDPALGWCWIPGNEWGPSWVSWRRGQHYAGWAPLPPDRLIAEYRNRPDDWVFVRTRDLVAPRVATVILPPRERDAYIRDTVVVNRTVVLSHRRFAVDPGIAPSYVAAAYGRPIPAYRVRPYVLAGTATIQGAATLQPDELRNQARIRQIASESVARQGTTTIAPARNVPPPQALGANARGRLGNHPPRAAANAGTPGAPGAPGGAATTGAGAMPQRGVQQEGPGMQPGGRGRPGMPGHPGNGPQPSPTTGAGGPQHPNESRPGTMGQGQPGGNAQGAPTTNLHGATAPNIPGKLGAQGQKGPAEQTEGAGAPGTPGHGPNVHGAAQQPIGHPLNQDHGRGHALNGGAAPQTSGQGPMERNRGHEPHGALPRHMPNTNGAGPGSPEPRGGHELRPGGRGPEGPSHMERGPAAGAHGMPHASTTGAGPHGPARMGRAPEGMHGGAPHAMRGGAGGPGDGGKREPGGPGGAR